MSAALYSNSGPIPPNTEHYDLGFEVSSLEQRRSVPSHVGQRLSDHPTQMHHNRFPRRPIFRVVHSLCSGWVKWSDSPFSLWNLLPGPTVIRESPLLTSTAATVGSQLHEFETNFLCSPRRNECTSCPDSTRVVYTSYPSRDGPPFSDVLLCGCEHFISSSIRKSRAVAAV